MSTRADLFVATTPEASRHKASLRRSVEAPSSEAHVSDHIARLELRRPWAILGQQSRGPEHHTLMELPPEERGGTWQNEFPGRFAALLVAPDDKGAEALERWAATDELQCDPRDLRPELTAPRALPLSALRQGTAVFLWGSA